MTNYFTPPIRNLYHFMRIYGPVRTNHEEHQKKGTASPQIGVSHTGTLGLSHTA